MAKLYKGDIIQDEYNSIIGIVKAFNNTDVLYHYYNGHENSIVIPIERAKMLFRIGQEIELSSKILKSKKKGIITDTLIKGGIFVHIKFPNETKYININHLLIKQKAHKLTNIFSKSTTPS